MPTLTLGQAAKEAKRSKATILEAIRNGRLTAPKDDFGRYQIDPAELFRVYPPSTDQPNGETNAYPRPSTQETAFLTGRIERLEAERERERTQLQETIHDLRRRLDQSEEARGREAEAREQAATELRRLTLLITQERNQQEAAAKEIKPPTPTPSAPSRYKEDFWLLLVALVMLAGVAVFWLFIKM